MTFDSEKSLLEFHTVRGADNRAVEITCCKRAKSPPRTTILAAIRVKRTASAALPGSIRACAYDRAGSGKSDPGPEPRTMDAEVGDLHALLERSGIAEPIVFVGQSLGGILGRLFVQEYPHSHSVAGMILLDPTDENDVVFNTQVKRWITVRELEGPLGDGARSVAKARQADPVPLGQPPYVGKFGP